MARERGGEGHRLAVRKGNCGRGDERQICVSKTGKPSREMGNRDGERTFGHWNLWLRGVVAGHCDGEGQVGGGLDGDLTAGASGSFITSWAKSWRSYLSTR